MKLLQSLDTTGARAAETFVHEGVRYLVIPQLAADVPGQPASMTLGNSNTEALVWRWEAGAFQPFCTLPVPGGEDAEFFRIGERAFLAMASLRTGAGPYSLDSHSTIYELVGGEFVPFQRVPTFAAKQWKHFCIGERDFLALAQGAVMEGVEPRHSPVSAIFEWTGSGFAEFQRVKSAWGYNWLFFDLAEEQFLAYADHIENSRILRWNGGEFEPFQVLEERTGRAFCFFESEGQAWFIFACLHGETIAYTWDGMRFVRHQAISGPGGRELRWLEPEQRLLLVNFLHGSREEPQPSLQSAFYRLKKGRWVLDEEFPTLGGTDAAVFREDGVSYMVVAHSLSEHVRFRTESKVYRLEGQAATP